ncbi:MAG: hypothetical protein ACYC35_18265 [Pirellulales bacterium]
MLVQRTALAALVLAFPTIAPCHAAEPAGPREPFNYCVGTQTFAPKYQFTRETRLVETARAILELGSNAIKFDMGPGAAYHLPKDESIHTLSELAEREPSYRAVLRMPLDYYLIWAYPRSISRSQNHTWRDGLSSEERQTEYRELNEFARYLLTTFDNSGKTFLLGHWEGDWALLGHTRAQEDPTPAGIQGMIDWLNVRQQAVDDARRTTPHRNVWIYHYTEVNLVRKAITGGKTVTNDVLPKTNVDYVSYSSYDSLAFGHEPDLVAMKKRLIESLDYIESKLPPKKLEAAGNSEKSRSPLGGRRVFIGEYGFPLQVMKTPEVQDRAARATAAAALEWGCPLSLYWQMYDNEAAEGGGNARGFWLIDNQGRKQPVYDSFQRFLAHGREYRAAFRKANGRDPSFDEYRKAAAKWLGE